MRRAAPLILILLAGQLSGQTAEHLIDRGYAKYLTEDFAGAIADFDLAIAADPVNDEVHFLKGTCLSIMGENEKAIFELGEAIRLNPQYAEAYNERGVIFLTDQNPQLAIPEFDAAIRCQPDFAQAYVNRGTARCMLEDAAGATLDWSKAKQLGISYTEFMICE